MTEERYYMAARYDRREELCGYADELRNLGGIVECRWLLGGHQLHPGAEQVDLPGDEVSMLSQPFAMDDVEDVAAADAIILFAEKAERLRRLPGIGEVEEWRLIPDSSLGYLVSNFGRVHNAEGEEILGKKSKGYRRVQPNGRSGGAVAVHKLVSSLFIGECPDGCEIDHIDGFKDNNYVGNLEYVSHLENIRRSGARMKGGPHAGENNGRAKLTYEDVADIRHRVANGETKATVSRDYDVSDVLIGKIARGELWPINERPGRGGRLVEFGLALGLGKKLIVIGPRENVFHCLPQVERYGSWQGFINREKPGR